MIEASVESLGRNSDTMDCPSVDCVAKNVCSNMPTTMTNETSPICFAVLRHVRVVASEGTAIGLGKGNKLKK